MAPSRRLLALPFIQFFGTATFANMVAYGRQTPMRRPSTPAVLPFIRRKTVMILAALAVSCSTTSGDLHSPACAEAGGVCFVPNGFGCNPVGPNEFDGCPPNYYCCRSLGPPPIRDAGSGDGG